MWISLFPAVISALVLLLFSYIAWVRPERYVRAWVWFWALLTARQALLAAAAARPAARPLVVLNWGASVALIAAAAALLLSARELRQVAAQGRNYLWLATVGAGWAYVAWFRPLAQPRLEAEAFAGVLLALAGVILFLSPPGCWARRFTALALLFWGGSWAWLRAHAVTGSAGPLAAAPARLLLAVAMAAVIYEEERRAMEEHLLGLSMLNLSGGGAHDGAPLPKILDGLLDRLRNIVRVRHVALWAGPPLLNESVHLIRGFSPEFQKYLSESAGPRLLELLPRYGGLAVARWRGLNGSLGGLDAEPFFHQLRQKLHAEGDSGFTILSLQSRKRIFGVLLLGQMGQRRFLPGELRFLLALSTQTAVALENLALVKASRRRSEEFEILTHIGTALSSSLTLEDLLRLIHSELRKLLDVRNFYVAFQHEESDEIRFELEVEEDVALPKRARPRRNALTEHVLRSGHPLLISQDVAEFSRQAGLNRSGRNAKCWLGVPILMQGRPQGVMAVQSYEQAGAFDQDHLRILEIVAGQSAVAIENARLFAEEQRNARQMAFFNQIGGIAISTLNPDEMLAAMTREIEKHLDCDYIGVGVVNYQSKELEFKAEGGRKAARAGLPLRRLPLGVGIVGAAARTGQLMLVNELRQNRQALPVHGDAAAALAVPIVYSGQTLGILNLESEQPGAFAADQLPALRGLADQLAMALNNSLVFHQMQQQAITDGLTGLKTRRFFMEALQSEWKRASRSGRAFSVILIDLDNFKQINDTLGHLEGDLTLTRLARILEQKCRGSNIVARYGGDEFTILMPEGDSEQARALCERLQVWISTDTALGERRLRASFGLASFPEHGATPEEVLRAADVAMYSIKGSGGDGVASTSDREAAAPEPAPAPLGAAPAPRRLPAAPRASGWSDFSDPGAAGDLAAALPALFALTSAIDAKDALGSEHSLRVSRYAALIARALKLAPEDQENIRLAGRLHDLGKCSLGAELLRKQELSGTEWAMLRAHPLTGAEMVAGLRGGDAIAPFLAAHHEWFDGSGYPRGMKGDEIPLGGRVLALAEAFDAMTSSTSHRPALTFAAACVEIERTAGRQFDALLVRVFLRALQEESESFAAAAHAQGAL